MCCWTRRRTTSTKLKRPPLRKGPNKIELQNFVLMRRPYSPWLYTVLQKKRNFSEPIFPGDPGSLTLTPGHVHFVKWFYKVHLSTIFPKRNATFHAAFLLKKSVLISVFQCYFSKCMLNNIKLKYSNLNWTVKQLPMVISYAKVLITILNNSKVIMM